MTALYSESAMKILAGVVALMAAVVFLLGGMELLYFGNPIFSQDLDIVIAFGLMIVGLAMVFSETAKG